MPWACPLVAFYGDKSWSGPLLQGWDHDFIFPSRGRGQSLQQGCVFTDEPASPYIVLSYLQEILMLPSVSLPPAEAKLMRRHSMRHWIANAVRILRFPLSDAFMGGRWKEMAVMPLRYSQETKFVAVVDVIKRVLTKCEEAFVRTPPEDWPVFGGWELLLAVSDVAKADRQAAEFHLELNVTPEEDESGGDSSGDEADVAPAPAPQDARLPVRAAAKRSKALPDGWRLVEHKLESGRVIPTYIGPSGERKRSLKQAWAAYFTGQQACRQTGKEYFSVGDCLCVWWPGDECFYGAVVLEISDSDCWFARVKYDYDGEILWHDFSVEDWKISDNPEVSPALAQGDELEPAPPAQSVFGAASASTVGTVAKQPLYLRNLAPTWSDGAPSVFQPAPDGAKRGVKRVS